MNINFLFFFFFFFFSHFQARPEEMKPLGWDHSLAPWFHFFKALCVVSNIVILFVAVKNCSMLTVCDCCFPHPFYLFIYFPLYSVPADPIIAHVTAVGTVGGAITLTGMHRRPLHCLFLPSFIPTHAFSLFLFTFSSFTKRQKHQSVYILINPKS